VQSPADEIRTPIDVLTLAAAVLELCRTRFAGTIHLGATDSVDRFTLTRRAAELQGYDAALVTVQPRAAATGPARAARHRRGVIVVEKARRLLRTPMMDWQAGLRRAIDTRPAMGAKGTKGR
jgi:dTDP-4-dehydrorhamnose reductase